MKSNQDTPVRGGLGESVVGLVEPKTSLNLPHASVLLELGCNSGPGRDEGKAARSHLARHGAWLTDGTQGCVEG